MLPGVGVAEIFLKRDGFGMVVVESDRVPEIAAAAAATVPLAAPTAAGEGSRGWCARRSGNRFDPREGDAFDEGSG